MYEALDRYDRDWLIRDCGQIPYTDFVTLLFTNPAFTEASWSGLSDEMGRELFWRGYPTDQRGTYFRRFWESAPGTNCADHPPFLARAARHRTCRKAAAPRARRAGRARRARTTLSRPDRCSRTAQTRGPRQVDPHDLPRTSRILFHAHLAQTFCWSASISPRRRSSIPTPSGGSSSPSIQPPRASDSTCRRANNDPRPGSSFDATSLTWNDLGDARLAWPVPQSARPNSQPSATQPVIRATSPGPGTRPWSRARYSESDPRRL